MRERIARAIWGVRRKSFEATVSYLKKKHYQVKSKLVRQMDELRREADFSDEPTLPTNPFHFELKKGLFGLNPKQVAAYMKDLKKLQENELEEIRSEIQRMMEIRKKSQPVFPPYPDIDDHSDEVATTMEVVEEVIETVEEIAEEVIETIEEMAEEVLETTEEWKIKAEEEIRERLYIELKEKVKREWIEEQRAVRNEEKQETTRGLQAKVSPIHPMMPKAAVPQMKQRTSAIGGGFWEEDITHLLFQPHSFKDENVPYPLNYPTPLSVKNEEHTRPVKENYDYETKASPVIADHASQLRLKYIVGKMTGKDLTDSNGRLIAAQNTVITEEVIHMAEREGKLAELIVNMVIQGLGE
ncbi:MAG: hypothetical protein K0Q73_3635 [Paenibacillus sp.]|nr:hypothetical protein [Paenibacillus sp.]